MFFMGIFANSEILFRISSVADSLASTKSQEMITDVLFKLSISTNERTKIESLITRYGFPVTQFFTSELGVIFLLAIPTLSCSAAKVWEIPKSDSNNNIYMNFALIRFTGVMGLVF